MPPKKQYGFMIFANEWKGKHGQNMTISQVTDAIGPIWSAMTAEQREPYIKRAQKANEQPRKKGKLTCIGIPIDRIEKEQREKEKMEEIMLKTIKRTIKLAVNRDGLKYEKFYFVMVNYFVRLLNSEVYIPAEIAVVEFSLMDGVSRKYHKLVSPQTNLYGNVYDAKIHADTTHNLPLPPDAMGESDMGKISSDIFKFIFDKNSDGYPPLYTHNDAVGYISSALSYIATNSESEDNDLRSLSIYSIQELFFALKCATCDLASIVKPRNQFVSDTVLERDVFEYANNIACDYHEEIDRSKYCALSQVNRWGFSFADYMCMDLSITLISGRHMPDTVNASVVMKVPSSCVDDEYLDGACGLMSSVSLESNYQSCNDNDQASLVEHQNKSASQTVRKSIVAKLTSRVLESDIDFIYSTSEYSHNPWKRHDDSKPPDSRFFSIDYEMDDDISFLSRRGRGRTRGRGIAILDDFKP